MSCRVKLQPELNTPELANQGLTRHTRNFKAGVSRQVGVELSRTEAGDPCPLETGGTFS